jgi:hypothetical protein
MQSSQQELLERIERYLIRHKMAPTTFGVEVMRDRHLVRRLRAGRSITLRTADRIWDYMTEGGKRRPSRRLAEARIGA